MAAPIQFVSKTSINQHRQEVREARESILTQAKSKYEREKRKEELAAQRGENTWMLPSVNSRIESEQKELEKVKTKKHKKEKKQKKEKKRKKEKKSKREKKESSTSDSDSDDGPRWVEKTTDAVGVQEAPEKGPKLEREDWMTAPPDFFPAISRQELRRQKNKDKEEEEKMKVLLEQPGQHERELNPYWKDGGTGLPEDDPGKVEKKASSSHPSGTAGDGGVGWMRKAYQRCVEAAKEEGRSLEDVAAERYGSLEKLESMLADAEEKARPTRRYGQSNRYERNNDRDRRVYSSTRQHGRESTRYRDMDKNVERDDKSRNPDEDRDKDQYSNRKRSSYKYDSESQTQTKKLFNVFMKPKNDDDSIDYNKPSSGPKPKDYQSGWKRRSFMKPGEGDKGAFVKAGESREVLSRGTSSHSRTRDSLPAWKKKGFVKPDDKRDRSTSPRHRSRSRSPRHRSRSRSPRHRSRSRSPRQRSRSRSPRHRSRSRSPRHRSSSRSPLRNRSPKHSRSKSPSRDRSSRRSRSPKKRSKTPDSSSSDSSRDSSSDRSPEHKPESQRGEPETEAPVALTEQEMNQLGAKILKAELMGNEALAKKLKTQLENAQKAKVAGVTARKPATAAGSVGKDEAAGDRDVLLTRETRTGMVIPVSEAEFPPSAGRSRKKPKVATHAKSGERERYFDDDERFDLKKMVEREKMGTAEDQNRMFSRLAGKGIEKTDEDWQVDDVFVSRAAKKQSQSKEEERDRSLAIAEHRKMAAALEKCPHCFDNIPKHLIIAIGIKVYLHLPNHRSLTDGHCLIVPMQHVASGTQVDEDVWDEIQVFRKGLTKMFEAMDEDVVFMETSMNLKRCPHMVIECVSMPREVGDMAPIYFKKAIMESESEWAQNKKLVDLSQRDVRRAIPKGFPYFAVDFGLQGGFAHVIEEERSFPSYFGREIVGGMLDCDPTFWRKPHKENFEVQRQKVLKFSEWWRPYDWTQRLKSNDN